MSKRAVEQRLGSGGIERIRAAVAEAERGTSAEIAVFVRQWTFWRTLLGQRANQAAIRRRAERLFVKHGLTETRDRNAIMIYVSLKEHVCVVLGDVGIDKKVAPGAWDTLTLEVAAAAKKGELAAGIALAVRDAGVLLATHFPRAHDDRNELGDAPNVG